MFVSLERSRSISVVAPTNMCRSVMCKRIQLTQKMRPVLSKCLLISTHFKSLRLLLSTLSSQCVIDPAKIGALSSDVACRRRLFDRLLESVSAPGELSVESLLELPLLSPSPRLRLRFLSIFLSTLRLCFFFFLCLLDSLILCSLLSLL